MRCRRATGILAALLFAGCQNVSKLDWSLGRDGWQRPDDVVRALALREGDTVADVGAGKGYFLPYLAAAVGPGGRVYAVEVDEEAAKTLEEHVDGSGANVTIVLAETDDPALPDGEIDLVLLVNTFHHIEDRPAYFGRLRRDLVPGGRVAVIEPNSELSGLLSLFLDEGHESSAGDVREEMERAGYRPLESHEFLPIQIFELFTPEGEEP